MKERIEKVAVIGAGTMGQGIAQAVAMAEYEVILYDSNESTLKTAIHNISENLDKGVSKGKVSLQMKENTLNNIMVTHKISNVMGDLIIEAIVEDLQIKAALFSELEAINRSDTIFATNTSAISITHIGSNMKNPAQLAGLHFFNPAHIMKLVEVVGGKETDPAVVNLLVAFTKNIGKTPVMVSDSPGFIVNRVARHYYVESLRVLEQKVASHQVIDELLENFGFKMGPFKLMDLIGVDTNFAVTKSIFKSFNCDPKFQPSWIQQLKVESGHHGRKTGKGFYEY